MQAVKRGRRRSFFIIFVDRIFTSFLQQPFTKAFDAIVRIDMAACLCRTGHAD